MRFFCIPLFTCKHGIVETLDYSQLRLEEVPKEILKSRKYIEELLLNVNGIEELPAEFFRCTKLRKLDISENKIKVLPPEIGALQALLDLNLSKNEFVEIPEEIGECRSLMSLNISTNIVPGLPKSIINLSALTHLNVSNNSLTLLPADIDRLVSLQCLDAGQCELRFLPQSVIRLANLKFLDLCENYLTELPKGMEGLVSLEILDVRNNMITHLPEDILHCRALRNLDVTSNSLSELPSELGDLINLTELSACDNQLAILPNSIGQLKNLEILKASKNRITALTPAICSCVLLTDLILCENQLSELPSSLGNLKRLKFLDVNVNNLRHLPMTIGGCSALGVLTLRHNQLEELPMEIGRLSQLQVLDLIDNNLTYLPFTLTVLYDRKSLSALWLSFNQPALPKLSVTNEPIMNVKVLTCYLLPQRADNQHLNYNVQNKSCVGGARVCFAKEWTSSALSPTDASAAALASTTADADDEAEKLLPVGRFERYDTPHPKPFAPKNRLSRNSGDFSSTVADALPNGGPLTSVVGDQKTNNAAHSEPTVSTPRDAPVSEMRPLRSVLKRRPQSVASQQGLLVVADDGENKCEEGAAALLERKSIQVVKRSPDSAFGWNIAGGADSVPYKGRTGVFISHLVEGGLAQNLGFRVDDRLTNINGVELDRAETTHTRAVELIKEAGEDIVIVVERSVSSIEPINGVSSSKSVSSSNQVSEPTRINSLNYPSKIGGEFPMADAENFDDDNDGFERPTSDVAVTTAPQPTEREIVAVTISRARAGSPPGFSIEGSGGSLEANASNRPITISALTPGGAAERSRKLRVGDRLLSVNGVNVKEVSHDRVVSLLTANPNADIYLIVERHVASPPPLQTTSANNGVFGLALSHAKSLPSLAQPDSPSSLTPPPIPPRTDLRFSRNNSVSKNQSTKPLAPNRSMNSLLFDNAAVERLRMPNSIAPRVTSPNNSAFSTVHPSNSYASSSALERLTAGAKGATTATGGRNNCDDEQTMTADNFGRLMNFEQPLATSSPIPRGPPLQVPSLANNNSSSQIPVPRGGSLKLPAKSLLDGGENGAKAPPPVAPKPKLIPERLNFSSKLQRFEEEINAQQKAYNSSNFGARTLSGSNGASFISQQHQQKQQSTTRRSGIPMKKPLVSSEDLEKLRAEEAKRRIEFVEEEEGTDSVRELFTNDTCFNQILQNGSTGPILGPLVVRTRNAEIRVEKVRAMMAARAAGDGASPSSAMDVRGSSFTAGAPPDDASLSRASSSLSSMEQRAADLEKRQAWRQARLKSMDVESQRTDDVLKLITSIPSSPIPIQ